MAVLIFDRKNSLRTAYAQMRVAPFIPIGAAGCAVLVALFGYASCGEGAWGYATDLVLRYATLVYILAFALGPAARLFAGRESVRIALLSRMMLLGFAAAYAVFLLCVMLPFAFATDGMPLATFGFCVFDGFIVAVLAVTASPDTRCRLGARTAETFHRLSVGFFWVAFAMSDVAHLYGPHRPDRFYGISLCLLICVLLVRFADAAAAKVRLAEKVGHLSFPPRPAAPKVGAWQASPAPSSCSHSRTPRSSTSSALCRSSPARTTRAPFRPTR